MTTAAVIAARLTLDSSDYNAGLSNATNMAKNFGSKMSQLGGALTQVGGMMTALVTVPVVAGLAASVEGFVDLDKQMKNIQSISRGTNAETEALRQTFIAMSKDLSVTTDSARNLAEAYYYIQSAGYAGADAQEVLRVSTKAATAGLTDTNTAGRAIMATLAAYNMTAADAAYVSDVLFRTVDLGVLSFNDLASQLGDVVNTAANANVPIDVVGAALAQMTRKGISAAESVTALNQLMLQFISPSEKMRKAAQAMGVDISLAALKAKGLPAVLQEIYDKGGGADALLTLFGDNVRALKGAMALASDGGAEFNQMIKDIGDSAGRTNEAFATQTESVAAKWENLKNNLMADGLQIAGILMPTIDKIITKLKELSDWFDKLSPSSKNAVVGLLFFAAAIGPLLLTVGMLIMVLGSLATIIGIVGIEFALTALLVFLLVAGLVALGIIAFLVGMYLHRLANIIGEEMGPSIDKAKAKFAEFIASLRLFASQAISLIGLFAALPALLFIYITSMGTQGAAALKSVTEKIGTKLREMLGTLLNIIQSSPLMIVVTILLPNFAAAVAKIIAGVNDMNNAAGGGSVGGKSTAPANTSTPRNKVDPQMKTPRGASGLDFVVPQGYPNDSFPINVQSGEHVKVTKKGEDPGGGQQSMLDLSPTSMRALSKILAHEMAKRA